jgi:glucose/arabinose dehydrogenase
VSFDPRDDYIAAGQKKASYVRAYGKPGAEQSWHFLTGSERSSKALTEAVGFRFAFDAASSQYVHPSTILVLTREGRVARYDDIEAQLDNLPQPAIVNDEFPSQRAHGWKFIRFGPDGKLYVPVGAPCNVCDVEDTGFGSITRMNPDGSDLELFAIGVRNSVGFDWHPETEELWFTDNGRDQLGDDIPPDELNHAPEAGLHFGFPYCHGGTVPDPELGQERSCEEFTPPAMTLGPHVASLGMRFYTGSMFPDEYRNQIFIAEHGSWNRSTPLGYRIMLVRLEDNEAVSYEVFAEGWLRGGEAWGRPVDLQVMPDGSLLVSDDTDGAIYRISYE